MKPFTAIFLAACLFSLRPAAAQEAGAVPIPENTPSPTPPPASPSLFPNETPPPVAPRPPRGPGGGTATGGNQNPAARTGKPPATVENIADNIAYRKAKTKALRDEKVQQAWEEAQAARNDPDKRAALKRYYTLLADRILKIDGSIKKLVAARLKQSLKELDDSKVRPSDAATAGR